MSKKAKILLATYLTAVIVSLGAFSWANHRSLQSYRRSASYSARHAYEETVTAVDALSESLMKSLYATDGSMCSRICSEAYANALAAQSAISTLPFSTQELEQTSGFIGRVGDYAYTLCSEAAAEGFTEEQVESLTELSQTASAFAEKLRTLQSSLSDGLLAMDDREARLLNIGIPEQTQLSDELLSYEAEFPQMSELSYDGKYSARQEQESPTKTLSRDEMLQIAADFLGADPAALRLEYEYEGQEHQRCFSMGDIYVCVSGDGVDSMSESRVVSETKLSLEDAQQAAEDFLQSRGYEALRLESSRESGSVAVLRFAECRDDTVFLNNTLIISMAMDDGSVHAFNAEAYRPDVEHDVQWNISETQATEKLPRGLELEECRKVCTESPGGRELACYELRCSDENGNKVKLYIEADQGRQVDILLDT